MKLSNFDIFVNKILKESLIGGSVSSTSVKPAEAQEEIKPFYKNVKKQGESQQIQGSNITEPPQEKQEPVEQDIDSTEQIDTQENILTQMKDDSKKRDEFEKKFIAALTNMAKSTQTPTPQPQQPVAQPTPILNPKQMFGGNISI